MKTESSRAHLSIKAKLSLVKRVREGESISTVARFANVSRTILYKWIKEYASKEALPARYRLVRKKRAVVSARIKLTALQIRKIKKLAIAKDNTSIRQIAKQTGVSVGAVWNTLSKEHISSKGGRQIHRAVNGDKLFRCLSYGDRVNMFSRYKEGEKVSRICRDFQISRTVFYRWLKRFKSASGNQEEALQDLRPRSSKHWRSIQGVAENVLPVVAKNPELSLREIYVVFTRENGKIISQSGLYYVLKKLHLSTQMQREVYAKSLQNASTQNNRLIDEKLPEYTAYSSISSLSPPLKNSLFHPKFIFYAAIFLLVTLITVIFTPGFIYQSLYAKHQPSSDSKNRIGKNIKKTVSPVVHPENYKANEDFSWGVLAMNTTQDTYRPKEEARVEFGVLDNQGKTICQADLALSIKTPSQKQIVLTSAAGEIGESASCKNGYSPDPDYQAKVQLDEPGDYRLHISAKTANGIHSEDQVLQAVTESPFVIARSGFPTRIYPANSYIGTIRITAKSDYDGVVTEKLPATLGVSEISDGGVLETQGTSGTISWHVSLRKGTEHQLSYTMHFPQKSPELYQMGPVKVGSYQEQRVWQVAADAPKK